MTAVNRPDSGPWRVGEHYGLHVYAGDTPVATFHRAEDAARAVAAINADTRVRALIAHMDSGVISVAALQHALTGEPMPDGVYETAAVEARLAAYTPLARVLAEACLHARLADARACPTCGPATERELAAISVPDPLTRVLAEVAAEVQPGLGLTGLGWSRSELIAFAADCLTRVLAIDAAAGDR